MTTPRPDVEKFIEDIELLGLHIDEPDCTLCRIRVMCQTLLTYLRAVEGELQDAKVSIDALFEQGEQARDQVRSAERVVLPTPPDAAAVERVLVRARRDLDAWEIGQGPSPFTRETLKQIDQTLAALRAARGAP